MRPTFISAPPVVLFLALCGCVQAGEIYHWVDENGVQHFSQTAPASGAMPFETVTLEETPPLVSGTDDDLYNVAATAERTQALREELDKKRQERLERQRREAAQPVRQYPEPIHYAVPWWWNRPGYQPPPRPPRPERPPVPEPYPTATLKPPGGNSG